ncbi:unnamed protein product, partial [Prorocentrum cordatum]
RRSQHPLRGPPARMVHVLWGVACLSVPGPATTSDVVRQVRDAFALGGPALEKGTPPRGERPDSADSDDSCSDGSEHGLRRAPRVDLYRLVPLAADGDDALAPGEDERVVAVLPDSSFSCAELEEAYSRRDEGEARYARAREALAQALEATGGGSRDEALEALQQENRLLRHQLDKGEAVRRELHEDMEALRAEFVALVREVTPLLPAGGSSLGSAPSPCAPDRATGPTHTSAAPGRAQAPPGPGSGARAPPWPRQEAVCTDPRPLTSRFFQDVD